MVRVLVRVERTSAQKNARCANAANQKESLTALSAYSAYLPGDSAECRSVVKM